jgi:hypothetical protein
LKPISSGLSPIYFDLRNRERLCVTVGHCAYFMSKSRSFVFVWHHFVNDTSHWAYQAAK